MHFPSTRSIIIGLSVGLLLGLSSCGGSKTNTTAETPTDTIQVPDFSADSAYLAIVRQCDFGPRVTGSEAHRRCGDYLAAQFEAYGCTVTRQEATFTRYDGVKMPGYNLIACANPSAATRLLIASHWDSRPWADADADAGNHRKPLPGANDGASGVGVMLELARLMQQTVPAIGVDFVCFDAEDCGTPDWDDDETIDDADTWCLGSQHWARQPHRRDFRYGILLDMVGGQGARFYREGYSMAFAPDVVSRVWSAAAEAGYSSYFVRDNGGYVTDDHGPVNRAGIPMIDIIAYHPYARGSHFGPTWHTMQDTPENIDRATLQAVGQSLTQLIYTEQ